MASPNAGRRSVQIGPASVKDVAELVAVVSVLGSRCCLEGAAQALSLWGRAVGSATATTLVPLSWLLGLREQSEVSMEIAKLKRSVQRSPLASFIEEAYRLLKGFARVLWRSTVSVIFACLLYMLPLWGQISRTELHLLPSDMGAEAAADVHMGQWAASLQADFIAIDADLELAIPRSRFNLERLEGPVRVDFELGALMLSRPLVLPQLTPSATLARELMLALPMALGLFHDEHAVRLSLGSGLSPSDLVTDPVSVARLRVTPALITRQAQIVLRPRPSGPLGKPLTCWLVFVPLCAIAFYRVYSQYLDREADARAKRLESAGCGSLPLTAVEVQMITQAFAGLLDGRALGGVMAAHFSRTMATFESEDRRLHGEALQGKVPVETLAAVIEASEQDWSDAGLNHAEAMRVVDVTRSLKPSQDGLLFEGGRLQYRAWLALATVSQLCGERGFADYATLNYKRLGCL